MSGVENHRPRGTPKQEVHTRKDRSKVMPTNSGYSEKSQNQNNFSMGRENMTWLERTMCKDTEDKKKYWAHCRKSLESQA